jgi:cytochrome c oxidase subunit I
MLHVLSSAGASVLGFGYISMFCYLPFSLIWGPKVKGNPWPATGLEWEAAPCPPPPHNFDAIPVVTEDAYNYEHKDDAFYEQVNELESRAGDVHE